MAAFDLRECLARVRQRDQDSARALVEHLYPLVMRIVRSHRPRRATEEDLAQEVFLKLFSRLDQYQERDQVPFEHWVARLTVRTCLDCLRAERRRPENRWTDLSEEETHWLEYVLATQAAEPETSPAAAREMLERFLTQLPPQDRLVITWLDLEQRTLKDISRETGWSLTRIKVRAFRARQKLRKIAARMREEIAYE